MQLLVRVILIIKTAMVCRLCSHAVIMRNCQSISMIRDDPFAIHALPAWQGLAHGGHMIGVLMHLLKAPHRLSGRHCMDRSPSCSPQAVQPAAIHSAFAWPDLQ